MSGWSAIQSTRFLGKPLIGSTPVLSVHSFTVNCQLFFLNQQKRKNSHRNVFMTKSSQKNVLEVGINLAFQAGGQAFETRVSTVLVSKTGPTSQKDTIFHRISTNLAK